MPGDVEDNTGKASQMMKDDILELVDVDHLAALYMNANPCTHKYIVNECK